MIVRDAMATTVCTVTPDDRVATALRVLTEQRITGLPVVGAGELVLGVITELDILGAMRRGADLSTTPVSQIMHRRPVFAVPEMDLYDAVAVMEEWLVHRLPVCERGRLVGVISRGDVLRALAHEMQPA